MGLFKTNYSSDNLKKSIQAVQKLTDEGEIFDWAMNSKFEEVQRIAVSKLKNQELLLKLADAQFRDCNEEALEKLDNEHALKFAMESMFGGLVPTAIKRFKDEKTLLDIALKAKSEAARYFAAKHLSSQEFITKCLSGTEDLKVFKELSPLVKDVELKQRIVKNAKIKDQRVLGALIGPNELMDKCIKDRIPQMAEALYETTWEIDELIQLEDITNVPMIKERIQQRIDVAAQFEILAAKGYEVEPNDKTTVYLKALETKSALLDNPKEALWTVIAAKGLAEDEQILAKLDPDMTDDEAKDLILDILA